MSPSFEAPQFSELSRFQAVMNSVRRVAGRCALILSLAAGSGVAIAAAESIVLPNKAQAATEFVNDYPNIDAHAYNFAAGEWSVDEDGDGKYEGGDELQSPRGYYYRNCTDGAAYWTAKYTGINVSGWHHAKDWDTAASDAHYTVKEGSANDIEPGDIAQSDDGSFGHVGLVTGVFRDSDGKITKVRVAELNKSSDGNYSQDEYISKNSAGKFIRWGDRDWDHFIDVNGGRRGLNNEELAPSGQAPEDKTVTAVSSQITPDGTTHVYWADRTGKLKETWFKDGVKHTNVIKDFGITDITEVSSQYTAGDNMQHVYAGTTGGELWEFWFNPNTGGYQGRLIKDVDSEVTAMSSQITPDGIQRIYWATMNRQLYETWYSAGNNGDTYLRDASNSHIQAVTSQYTSDGTRHIYWGNDEGRLHERWINGTNTGLDVMATFPEEITALSSQTTPGDQQHVYSGDDSGQVRETWFSPANPGSGFNTWPVRSLGSSILGISSAYTPNDGIQHIYTGTASGNLSEIWFRPGQVDGRSIPLSPAPSKITALSSQYTPGDQAQHIYWGAPDGKVRESWFGPTGKDTWELPT